MAITQLLLSIILLSNRFAAPSSNPGTNSFSGSRISANLAQSGNPVLTEFGRLAVLGTTTDSVPATSPGKFKFAGKLLFLDEIVNELLDEKDERAALKEFSIRLIEGYAEIAEYGKYEYDCVAAFAFTICTLHSIVTGKEFSDAGYALAVKKLQKSFDVEAVRNATDKQKQEAYEIVLSQTAFTAFMAAILKDEEGKSKLRSIATAQLETLTGAKLSQITFEGGKFAVKASAPQPPKPVEKPAPAPSGGLAPGFTFAPPTGWTTEGAWNVGRNVVVEYNARLMTNAFVKFLPAVPAQGSFSDAIRKAWKENVPPEFVDKGSGMVFRRYIGDGLFCQFIFAKATEANRKSNSLFSVYLIDCGKYWQPFVVAQTYEEPDTAYSPGISFTTEYSFPTSADIAEKLFATFKCPTAKGKPIVDLPTLAGSYHFGSGAMMQWENIYTGASSMTHVSYGGTLTLNSNGTFQYLYGSATGVNGVSNFRSAKGDGKWTLQGDILTTTFKNYDQGDGHFVKEHTYRVAGVVLYSDGVKVLVLKSNLNQPVNACTVSDSSEYYSTKKK